MNKKHRIFIAINLPNDIKKQLDSYKNKWRELSVKWINIDNMHITLEFLGNITSEELGEVCVAVKEVVLEHNSFNISLKKVLYWPPGKIPPQMIWVKGEGSKELSSLKTDLQKSLLKIIRFAPGARVILPHITLARISGWEWKKIEPEERLEINENIDFVFTVESIEVMESVLKKRGPEYIIIESHSLKD